MGPLHHWTHSVTQENLVNIPEVGFMLMYKLENHDNIHNWNVDFEEYCVFFYLHTGFLGEPGEKTKQHGKNTHIAAQNFISISTTRAHSSKSS